MSAELKMHTENLVAKNIEKLTALFPNCITEMRNEQGEIIKGVDFDLLRQELSEVLVEGNQERYRLDWVGKKQAILAANEPIAKTLRPCREESVNFDTTQNLFIEGDNLDALKLLQETYLGKVKMIYIDPPYNTGNDFIYNDDFAENYNEFLARSNQIDEEGYRLTANTESNGRFHSDWLSMMYSRLKLARNLLSDDGVIFISIDECEYDNLRKLCNEIFGTNNFVDSLIWKKLYGGKNDSKWFLRYHDYILVYAKNKNLWYPNLLPRTDKQNDRYKNPDNDPRGPWKSGDFTGIGETQSCRYKIISPSGAVFYPKEGKRWIVNQEKFNELLEDNRIWFGSNQDSTPSIKRFLSEVKNGISQSTFLDYTEVGHSDGANRKLAELLEGKFFDYPKPVELLHRLSHLGSNKNALILDFFAGSSTTAHAVMQLNAEDNGNRRFIMVQLPEKTDEKSEAYKAGYSTIAEISKERIRRAGNKIIAEQTDRIGSDRQDYASINSTPQLDIGFRVLKIDSTNMKDVYYTPDKLSQSLLDQMTSHIKEDRSAEDLLFQVMLDWGIELSLSITRKTIDNATIYFVGENSLVACFDPLTPEIINEIAQAMPLRVVSCESAIIADHDKTNIKERFKQLSPDTEVRFL